MNQSISSALLTLCLAYRIHKTDAAVIATCHAVRDTVPAKWKPVITRIMRCKSPGGWVKAYEKEMGL